MRIRRSNEGERVKDTANKFSKRSARQIGKIRTRNRIIKSAALLLLTIPSRLDERERVGLYGQYLKVGSGIYQ